MSRGCLLLFFQLSFTYPSFVPHLSFICPVDLDVLLWCWLRESELLRSNGKLLDLRGELARKEEEIDTLAVATEELESGQKTLKKNLEGLKRENQKISAKVTISRIALPYFLVFVLVLAVLDVDIQKTILMTYKKRSKTRGRTTRTRTR